MPPRDAPATDCGPHAGDGPRAWRSRQRRVAGFGLIALGIYLGLMLAYAPIGSWPGLGRLHAHVLAALGSSAFADSDPERSLRLTVATPEPADGKDLIILGHAGWRADSSSLLVGYGPLAMAVALVLATPAPWNRRAASLAICIALMHCVLVARMGGQVWFAMNGPGSGAEARSPTPPLVQHVGVAIYDSSVAYGVATLVWILSAAWWFSPARGAAGQRRKAAPAVAAARSGR